VINPYIDLRKAYRFLQDFHKRLRSNQLMLVKEIDPTFNFVKMEPMGNDTPGFGQAFQIKWISDYFPLLNHRIIWASEQKSTLITLDTYMDSDAYDYMHTEEADLDAKKMAPAEQSSSFIHVYLYRFEKYPENLMEAFNQSEYCEPFDKVVQMNNMLQIAVRVDLTELNNITEVTIKLKNAYQKLNSAKMG